MSRVNRFGLFVWLLVILGATFKSPFGSWTDFLAFVLLAIVGSICLLAANKYGEE